MGSALIWGSGSYREIVKSASGAVIWDAVTASASGGGGGGGNVDQVATISALRALTSVAIPVVVVQNYAIPGDAGGGVFTYNSADTTTTDNNCTIFVDAASHRWYRQSGAVPIDVRWCGAKGDGITNDTTALQSAVSVGPAVYAPTGNYRITGSVALRPHESLTGDGPNTTFITGVKNGTPYPLITTTAVTTSPSPNGACDFTSNYVYSLCGITVSGLTLNTTGSTPVAGDDGISFVQYVNDSTISNLFIENQWNGLTLGPADSSFVNNVISTTNYNNGLDISNSTYSALQWNLNDLFLTQNESNGLNSHVNVGAGYVGLYVFGGPPQALTQVTLGTWSNINTFGNVGHAISATGNATGPVPAQGVRVIKGFLGQDGSDEIYLDTYSTGGGAITLEPNYIELAGTSSTGRTLGHASSGKGAGIATTTSVGPVSIRAGVIKQNSYDGIISNGSSLVVNGGLITDNGTYAAANTMVNGFSYTIQVVGTTNFMSFGAAANTVGTVFTKTGGTGTGTGLVSTTGRSNGIFINGGGAGGIAINGVQAGNSTGNSTQLYGIASNIDYVAISGSNFLNNTTAPVTGTAMTNSVTAGSLPIAINTSGGAGAYCPITGCTFTGPVVASSGLQVNSLGIGAAPDGTTAHITGPGGGVAFAGGLNVNITGALAVTGNVQAQSLYATKNLGVGTTPSATGTGDAVFSDAVIIGTPTGSYQTGSLNADTAVLVNNVGIAVGSYCALTGCTMTGPLVVNSSAQVDRLGIGAAPDGTTAHITGPGGGVAFAGGVNVNFTGSQTTTGTVQANTGFYGNTTATISGVTTVTASGQVQGQDLYATRSLGVQTSPSGTAGRLDAAALSFFPQGINAGTASSFGNAFHGGVTIADGGMTFTTAVVGNGLTVDNISAVKSVGIGVSPSGTTGQLAVSSAEIIGSPTGSYQANSLNVTGALLVNNVGTAVGSFCALSGCTMSGNIAMGGNNISGVGTLGTSGLATLGSASVTGAFSINSGMTIVGTTGITGTSAGIEMANVQADVSLGVGTAASGVTGRTSTTTVVASGALSGTTGTFSGQVQGLDLYATRAAGIGTTPTATSGRLNVGGINVNSSGLSYATGDIDVTGTVYATTGLVSQGAIAWHTCIYADTASGACIAGLGSLNVQTGAYQNGSAYSNP